MDNAIMLIVLIVLIMALIAVLTSAKQQEAVAEGFRWGPECGEVRFKPYEDANTHNDCIQFWLGKREDCNDENLRDEDEDVRECRNMENSCRRKCHREVNTYGITCNTNCHAHANRKYRACMKAIKNHGVCFGRDGWRYKSNLNICNRFKAYKRQQRLC